MKFIVFGEDWQSHPSSTQHIFKELAKSHDIVWINSIGMRKPTIKLLDVKRVFYKLKSLVLKKRHTEESAGNNSKLKDHTLPILPWHDNKLVKAFNKWIFNKKSFVDNEPIIYWVSVPTAIYLINLRPIDKIVYYCGDDFSALAGVDHLMVEPLERELILKADLIYVVSEFLSSKMPKHKVKLLSHGVDFDLFNNKKQKAVELSNINKPVIGFYGSLNAWLDKELLQKLALERPQYQIMLIGNIIENFDSLLSLNNVSHVPAVEHHKLATFSQHWHVSILPFVDNAQIRACDPLKLKEYLATGTPIVSTNFAAVRPYQEAVLIADSMNAFIERVDYAISISDEQKLNWRQTQADYAKNHSWQVKALQISDELGLG